MRTWVRGIGLGAAFGLAAVTVETWLGMIGIVERRMGPGPLFLFETAAIEIGLGAALGLLAAPLLRLRAGRFWQVLVLALAWAGLTKWVELDAPLIKLAQFIPPAGGFLLTLLGLWLGRRRVWVPLAAGLVLLAGGVAVRDIYLAVTTPPVETRAELPPARPGAPDVVVIVIDTVRARNVATYGYERPTSPTLDALAAEGAIFLDATSPSTWSLPSHASLFTGRYPMGHGAHLEHRFLSDTFPTLAEVFAHGGYDTFCFTANAWISDGLGLTRGFAFQDKSWKTAKMGRMFGFASRLLARLGVEPDDKGGAAVATNFGAWARERPADARPAFVFLNFIEAHFPYHQIPEQYLKTFTDRPRQELRRISLGLMALQFGGGAGATEGAAQPALDMYDGGVLYSDHLVGRVVEALRKRGTLDRTVFVVLGDHGELLGEHADFYGHGPSLYEPMIRVPLLLRYPPAIPAGARVEAPVSTVGVFGTVVDLARLEAPPTLHVDSLLPAIAGKMGGGPVLSERLRAESLGGLGTSSTDVMMQADRRYRAYRSGDWKLIESSKGDTLLFDLGADPDEARNLASERPEQLALLRAELAEVRAGLNLPLLDAEIEAGATPELDDATREQLRALGYTE